MKDKFLKARLFSAAICQKISAKVYGDGPVTMLAELVRTDYNLVAMIVKQC